MSLVITAVDAQLDAFNRQALADFAACFSLNVRMASLTGGVFLEGRAALDDYYRDLWHREPAIRAAVLYRGVVGDMVVDHERITGRQSRADSVSVVTYRVAADGLIDHVWFVR